MNIQYRECPKAFDSKADADLSGVKYHALVCGVNYLDFLYGGLPLPKALEVSEGFRDLAGCKFVISKFNKTFPSDVYPDTTPVEVNLKRAVSYFDIEGLKYIAKGSGLSSHLQFYDEIDLDTNENKIIFAIDMGDYEGVKLVTSNNHLSDKEYITAVKYSYYKEQLDIAEYLVSHSINKLDRSSLFQAIFSGILRSNPTVTHYQYDEHIDSLKNIDDAFPDVALKSLIDAIYTIQNDTRNTPPIRKSVYSDVDMSASHLKDIVSFNLFNERDQHFTVKDVVSFLGAKNSYNNKIDLFLPLSGFFPVGPFYSYFKIDDLFKNHRVYIPIVLPNFAPSFFHEISHALIYCLIGNNGLPYFETPIDMEEDYREASDKSLRNVFVNFTYGDYGSYEEIGLRKLLWLNHWYQSSNKSVPLTEKLFNVYFSANVSLDLHKKTLILERKHQDISQKYNWTNSHIYVLERLFEYTRRDETVKDLEFIVRIPELFVAGVEDNIMDNFLPIINYWYKYISPKVNEVRDIHFSNCKKHILDQKTAEGCMLFALSSKQVYELWKVIIDHHCDECLAQIYSNDFLKEALPIAQRTEILSYTASKVNYCVEYCFDDGNCTTIPTNKGWFEHAFQAIKGLFGLSYCTRVSHGDSVNTEHILIQTILSNEPDLLDMSATDPFVCVSGDNSANTDL